MANLDTVLEAIAKAKPAAAKGQYFKSATIATTMGPGVACHQTSMVYKRIFLLKKCFDKTHISPCYYNLKLFFKTAGAFWGPNGV